MKSFFISFSITLAVSSLYLCSCQKAEIDQQNDGQKEEFEELPNPGTLISATKLSTVTLSEAAKNLVVSFQEDFANIFDYTLVKGSMDDYSIVTYEIKYSTILRDSGGYRKTALYGDVMYLVDSSTGAAVSDLESVTLFNTCYNTCADDTRGCEAYIAPRTIFNSLVVFPLYQGGRANEDGVITIEDIIVPSEFLMKGRQSIDCEMAALALVDSLSDVKMKSGFYTENVGLSNGGGTALAVQYLLEEDFEYSSRASSVNLRSSYIGEGNISSKTLFDNIMNGYEGDGHTIFFNTTIDVNKLGSVGYVTTVVGTYYTWKDKYFKDIKLEDYFTPGKGKEYLDIYLANESSLLYTALEDEVSIKDIVPENLYETDASGNCSLKKGTIIDNMYEAFKENEVLLSGWNPKASMKITHSTYDEFLPYETNYELFKTFWYQGCDVSWNYAPFLMQFGHIDGTIYFMFKDVILKKHPVS